MNQALNEMRAKSTSFHVINNVNNNDIVKYNNLIFPPALGLL